MNRLPRTTSISRRQALAGGAVMAGVTVAGAALAKLQSPAKAAEPEGKWIDAHSHIWSTDLEHYPLAGRQTRADLDPESFTDDELMAVAAPEGVGRVVLIQHSTYHLFDNSYLLDAVRRHPGRFRVVGMVDDAQADPAAEMKRLLPLGVTGFRITPFIGTDPLARWLDAPGMRQMWQTGAQTGQAMCCLIDARHLPAVDKMCAAHPETPVVIDHFARIGADGSIRAADVALLCGLARHKKVAVKISAFYALGAKKPPHLELVPMIKRLFETFGPDRLMWASDCPYQLQKGNTYRDSIGLVRDKLDFVSPADRQRLLCGTAERIFFAG